MVDLLATPVINSVSPPEGSEAGGTLVTIKGTNLTGATGVFFGYATNATQTMVPVVPTVIDDETIICTSPASQLPAGTGPVNVVVQTAALQPSPISEVTNFLYTYGGSGFSTATIEHLFLNADGTGADGYIVFSLSDMLTNGGSTYLPTRFEVVLESEVAAEYTSGAVSVPITITPASNDTFVYTPFVGGVPEVFTIAGGTYSTLATLAAALNAATGSVSSERFDTKVDVTVSGSDLVFTAIVSGSAHNGDSIADHTTSTIITTLLGSSPVHLVGGEDEGYLTIGLVSTVDADTKPAPPHSPRWRLDFHIDGSKRETYWIAVPAGGGTWDLFDLIPTIQQVR